jgi:nucleotide-binding universal stress UspA family protein
MKAPGRILAAVDLSAASEDVLDAALISARAYQASVDVLHVREPLAYASTGGELPAPGEPDLSHQFIDDALTRIADRMNHAGVVCLTSTLDGPAAATIVDHARRSEADLIVIGKHGRGSLVRALLGSVAERVVHKAGRPVLVVPVPVKR